MDWKYIYILKMVIPYLGKDLGMCMLSYISVVGSLEVCIKSYKNAYILRDSNPILWALKIRKFIFKAMNIDLNILFIFNTFI